MRLLKPYECEAGMTPKFRSVSVMPIVPQICSQSASNCALRKRMARGAAVVPEVSLSRTGGRFPQFRALQCSIAAWRCGAVVDSSSGSATNPWRKQARKTDGQSGSFPSSIA